MHHSFVYCCYCVVEIEICAFSKDETIVVAAAKLEGGGSWLCCWELKHSQASPHIPVSYLDPLSQAWNTENTITYAVSEESHTTLPFPPCKFYTHRWHKLYGKELIWGCSMENTKVLGGLPGCGEWMANFGAMMPRVRCSKPVCMCVCIYIYIYIYVRVCGFNRVKSN